MKKGATPANMDIKTIPLTIGTYTKDKSKGIHKADFNTETGEINSLELDNLIFSDIKE